MDKRIIRVFLLFCPAATSSSASPAVPPIHHLDLSSAAVVDVDVDDGVDVDDVADDVDVDVENVVPPIHQLHPNLSSAPLLLLATKCLRRLKIVSRKVKIEFTLVI